MSVGYQGNNTQSGLNSSLGQIAVSMRNDCEDALQFFEDVNSLGVTGLENLGFSATDAQTFFNIANYLNTVAQVYYGQVAQPTAFDFDSGIAPARGGQ